jgi:anti-sigma factor RsiW
VLHCDEETLSLLALGEPGEAAVEAHLAECPRCRAELAALRSLVHAVRTPQPLPDGPADSVIDMVELDAVQRIVPPSRVWDQIAAATGVQTRPDPDETLRHALAEDSTDAQTDAQTDGQVPGPVRQPSVALPRQRSRSWTSRLDRRLLSVATGCLVVGLLVGGLGTRLLSDSDDPTRPTPNPVVAATRLDGLPAAPGASGQADVTESGQGRTLDLDVSKLGVANGFYEVWLIDPTVTKMVPIGVLSGAQGRFTLPAGVSLADYPVVDVSLEPLDGNPAHSGKSVLRGTLRS